MPDPIPATPEVLIVNPAIIGAIDEWLDYERERTVNPLRVRLPAPLPAFVGRSRLLLN